MNRLEHRFHITSEWISEYAQSIQAPLQMIHGNLIAPATMPIIFWQAFNIPWLSVDTPLIHGKQSFSYKAPITAGMIIDCELSLTKIEKKAGREGDLTLFKHSLICTSEGRIICTAETVLISIGGGV
ncbi:FAS1-like dehydratase domain-containing protein [Paenibacillus pini]|uniref:FAS1-like dehydratase domain-containing protein n=1 Tax=Paenibacillus pini JCM 16418 TaxID=1236976 RepID=W7YXC7_9BACL|nr:MaoC family dehydratase N-terminal domain-containing protein [Paenibacillus pini]GAF09356.1 hypothetical protein JCM16418_3495 [Paenibacillus pini JCM 16418]